MKNRNLFRFIIKYRLWIIIISIILTIFLGIFASKTNIDMGTYTLLPENDPEIIKFKQISENFGGFDNLIITIKGNDNLKMEQATEEIAKKIKGLSEFIKYVDYKYPVDFIKENILLYINDDLFYKSVELLKNNPKVLKLSQEKNNLSKMLLYLSSKNSFNEQDLNFLTELFNDENEDFFKILDMKYYYNEDKKNLLIFLRPTDATHDMKFFQNMVNAVEKSLNPIMQKYPSLNIGITGMPKIMSEQQDNLNTKIATISTIVLFLLIILFIFSFKKFSASIYIVIPILIAIIWTLGINYLIIGRLNIVTSIFSILLLGLGVDFSLHFLTKFYYEINSGKNVLDSLEMVFHQTLPGIFAGAITTAASFYVLMFSKFKGLFELGFIAGTGILMSLITITFILTAILSYSKIKPSKIQKNVISKRFTDTIIKYNYIVVILILAIIFIPLLINFRIEFNYNAFDLLPDIPSVRLENSLKEEYNNSFEYNILVANSIEESKRQYEELKKTDIYSEIDSLALLIPDNQSEKIPILKDLYNKYLTTEKPKIANVSLKLVIMLVQNLIENKKIDNTFYIDKTKEVLNYLNNLNKNELDNLQKNIKEYFYYVIKSMENATTKGEISIDDLPEYLKDKYLSKNKNIATFVFLKDGLWDEKSMKKVYTILRNIDENSTGTTFVWVKLIDYIREDLLRSSIYVFILIFFIVLIYFRKLKITLLTLTPVILGALWLLNFMSLLNIKFNIANIVVIPLILGIGIDDGIHMIHNYLINRSIIEMIKQSGKAVIITSLTSMIGFGSLYFVKDPLVSQMGFLLFFGIFFCLIISLTILPLFIQLFKKSIFNQK
ncbi:efflux RND transporter permease subunit [Marinitoga aeolica]|uniref:MMPL family transporter n=1 Tax=Marinitoga aeolica TaxID=2809031 RepID=A0ABY8PTG0_9BACT|nr:MMPL family transporter [Marinitoga aeolica]WGS65917.1 MMPL family transporter [Marinitoga aeolica]